MMLASSTLSLVQRVPLTAGAYISTYIRHRELGGNTIVGLDRDDHLVTILPDPARVGQYTLYLVEHFPGSIEAG